MSALATCGWCGPCSHLNPRRWRNIQRLNQYRSCRAASMATSRSATLNLVSDTARSFRQLLGRHLHRRKRDRRAVGATQLVLLRHQTLDLRAQLQGIGLGPEPDLLQLADGAALLTATFVDLLDFDAGDAGRDLCGQLLNRQQLAVHTEAATDVGLTQRLDLAQCLPVLDPGRLDRLQLALGNGGGNGRLVDELPAGLLGLAAPP